MLIPLTLIVSWADSSPLYIDSYLPFLYSFVLSFPRPVVRTLLALLTQAFCLRWYPVNKARDAESSMLVG
jgi:hypothetical protein